MPGAAGLPDKRPLGERRGARGPAELHPRAFPGWGKRRNTAGSPQAPSFLRTHLSWSAGDRAAAQAIFTRPLGTRPVAAEKYTGRNSGLRFPSYPSFRRKSCLPERLRGHGSALAVCSRTCRSASGSSVSDVAFGSLLSR